MTDPAFNGAGKTAGLMAWRVENFKLVQVAADHIGQFYTGDSYLVLSSRKGNSSNLEHDIYIWIGSESSTDEAGTCAIMAVQLDDSMGGTPVQHREEQGSESPEFLSLFKAVGGVIHLKGGVASGFHHVEAERYEPSLLHVKGRRNVIARQVPVAASSLNEGDVFILDLGFTLYLWAGASANTVEKSKGVEVMARLHSSRGGKTDRIVFADASDEAKATFWATLNGSEADVQAAIPDDVSSPNAVTAADVKVYKVSDASGSLAVTELPRGGDGRLTKDILPAGDVALVDVGTEVFVWVSKTASDAERKNGLKYAADFLAQGGRTSAARSTVVREGGESANFKSLFYHWDPPATFDFTRKSTGVTSGKREESIDFASIASGAGSVPVHNSAAAHAVTTTGVSAWIVQGAEVAPVPKEKVGEFFAGDSFVIRHEFTDAKGNTGITFYFWLGRHSDSVERGTAALTVRDMADAATAAAKGSKATVSQIRAVQGSEPPSLAAAFNGTLIVHAGGAKGALSASHAHLYHVKGSSPEDTKAVEVPSSASSLNSGDSFVLITPATSSAFLWFGKGSNAIERSAATSLASRLVAAWATAAAGLNVVEVEEGSESEAFWAALGGKAEYPASLPLPSVQKARLFDVSDVSGALRVSEVHNWSQEDLVEEDMALLDAGTHVFIWVGSLASPGERASALDVAEKYVAAAAAAGRIDEHVPVVKVESGSEPPIFTAQFAGWDSEKAEAKADPYTAKVKELAEARAKEAEKIASHAAALEAKRAAAIAAAEAKAAAGPSSGAEAHSSAAIAGVAGQLKHVEPAAAAAKPAAVVDAPDAITSVAAHLKHVNAAAAPAAAAPAPAAAAHVAPGAASGVTVSYNGATYSLDELKVATKENPGPFVGLNMSDKTSLLSAADFPKVFGLSAADFGKLAGWKQTDAKKKAGLF